LANFELLNIFTPQNHEILVKVSLSVALGLIIGLEREMTNKTAGLRTHILICLGSTVFTILSLHSFDAGLIHDGIRIQNDPARIAAQIVTGIGFIGGGAVLHYGVNIYGLTTAATIWITASLGMAVGAGAYELATITTLMTFLVLVVVRKIENTFLSNHISKGAIIRAAVICSKENMSDIQDWFYKEFKNIEEVEADKIMSKKNQVKLTYIINIVDKNPVNTVHKKILELENIESLSLKQVIK